jgi:hypothetical protein
VSAIGGLALGLCASCFVLGNFDVTTRDKVQSTKIKDQRPPAQDQNRDGAFTLPKLAVLDS